jgi:hypothetical protein
MEPPGNPGRFTFDGYIVWGHSLKEKFRLRQVTCENVKAGSLARRESNPQ